MSYYDDSLDDFDPGIGVPGPWLGWHPKDTLDGTILSGNWSLREAGGETEPLELKQMVLDWPISRTGWREDTKGAKGVSPRKQWNASRAKPEKAPADGVWKRAMQVRVAIAPDMQALWEQSGFGAYVSYVDIMRLIASSAQAELPKLPLLAWAGKRTIPTGGGPTLVAVFNLLRYVPPPACLLEMRALEAPTTAPAIAAPAAKPTITTQGATMPVKTSEGTREWVNETVPWDAPGHSGADLDNEVPWNDEE